MSVRTVIIPVMICCCLLNEAVAQAQSPGIDNTVILPSKLPEKLQAYSAGIDRRLTDQTEKYLRRMQRREERLRTKLYAADSVAAIRLFDGVPKQYAALAEKIRTDTGTTNTTPGGRYQPYVDSLQGALKFLQKNPQLLKGGKLQDAVARFQALQARMQDADQAQAFIQQRKQQVSQYLSQHAGLFKVLGKQYEGLNRDVYYYSQQLRQYREMWDHPDQLEKKMLAILNKLPAFQDFMKNNSQLGALFSLPNDYGSPQVLAGLQTRTMVAQQIQQQLSAGGPGAAAAMQSNLQSAENELDNYKTKLDKLGSGNGDMDMPDFKPNDQRTHDFLQRLEYGFNFQTTHNNYYFPTVTDLGLSLGYKLGHSNVAGVGASFKLGWGNGIQHIALSGQGVGLRSFVEIKIKASFFVTGGLEYNYTTPFTSFRQLKQIQHWTQSGLVGISKTVSVKTHFFKKTKFQLLWDLLSYQQVPKTQPLLFRIGYTL